MLNKGEVEVHTAESMNYLLCGQMPIISQARRRPIAKVEVTEHIDTSRFPPIIAHYSKSRPGTHSCSVRIRHRPKNPMPSYKKLISEQPLLDKAAGYLQTYGDNHERKTLQIHADWEERYMRPLLTEMRHKLNGRDYSTFRATRRRAETALGPRSPYSALSDVAAASLPSVRLSTASCDDRITRYRRHAEHEAQLTKFVRESQGIPPPQQKFKDRVTFDPEAWRLIPESRVYGHNTNGIPVRKGRRPFTQVLESRVGTALGHFPL